MCSTLLSLEWDPFQISLSYISGDDSRTGYIIHLFQF